MTQIPIVMRLVNPDDPYTRIAALWFDKEPPANWQATIEGQATADYKEWITSGHDTLVSYNKDLVDGKHILYLGVSQDEFKGLGVWSGTASIGGVLRPFDRVDYDTLAKFDFSIKNGKVIDSTKPTVVEKPINQTLGWKNKITSLLAQIPTKEFGQMISDNKVPVAVISAAAGASIGGLIWWAKKGRRRY
jgi:hypothetical protein